MKLHIRTLVNQNASRVQKGFNQDLFVKLSPPFPKVSVSRFDGCSTGNIVSLELNFLLFKQKWTSLIVHHDSHENLFLFIDEGKDLPFFLTNWKHEHRIENHQNGALIHDNIQYKTPFIVLDYLLWPLFFLQFVYRKPIYRRIFK